VRPKNDGKERARWNRSDLTTVRNCAIVRSVAIDRASYEHVRKLTDTVVNRSKLLVNSRITDKWRLSGLQVSYI
jgi:hypothetical protein